MDYIVIPTKNKAEKALFIGLLKKMNVESSTYSSDKIEDFAFYSALKQAEKSGKGDLKKVKSHLQKITSGK